MAIEREAELTPEKFTKEWMKNFGYEVDDKVEHNGITCVCILAHHSLDTTEPGEGATWTTYWDSTAETWDEGDNTFDDADNSFNNA